MTGLETPKGRAIAERALAIWEKRHIHLDDDQQRAFTARTELLWLVNVSEGVLEDAISKYPRIDKFVPYALACQLEISRKLAVKHEEELDRTQANVRGLTSSLGETQRKLNRTESQLEDARDEIRAMRAQLHYWQDAAAKSASNHQPHTTEDGRRRPKAEPPPSEQSAPHTKDSPSRGRPSSSAPTTGVAHRASGFSSKPNMMSPEFDDTERCSQCGARISASAASLHECHF